MPKYVYAYHGGSMAETDEEMAELMAAWGAWFEALGDHLVDGGNPISFAKTVQPDGSVIDGGGDNPLSGYGLVNAADIDAAVEMARGCPVLSAGGSVEVAEAIDM